MTPSAAGDAFVTLLAQALVAFTIEFDNEFELRMSKTWARPFKTSLVMWSNFMRFVPENGTTVGAVQKQSHIELKAVASVVGGMERWGYITVGRQAGKGFGSATGVKAATTVSPSATGKLARDLWEPLVPEIEERWRTRLGGERVDALRHGLVPLVERQRAALPRYLPVVSRRGLFAAAELDLADGSRDRDDDVPALLSRALLRLTLDYERDAAVSLPIAGNVLRVLRDKPTHVNDLPLAAAVSKEAVSVSLTWLEREGYASVGVHPSGRGKAVTATPQGREAQEVHAARLATVERELAAQVGDDAIQPLRDVLVSIFDEPGGEDGPLTAGLVTPPGGWRGTGRYKPLTDAFVANPREGLPQYPMVLHRGGWPDGS